MAKLLVLVTLETMIIMVHGVKVNYEKVLNRRDLFTEPKDPPPGAQNVVEAFITQRVDNFDPTNSDTWQQRYFMNGVNWRPGGCVFVLLAGDWEVFPDRLENTMVHGMSSEFGCYMFQLEHRYYGQSRPTEDISNENLRFLNVEQALADVAHFIEHIKSESVIPDAQSSPVIILGRHYAGSLAVWFRQSYPHLTVGAWASSSPTISVVDFFQHRELAGAVYRHIGGNECYERLERGFAAMEQMVANGQLEELSDMFQLCVGLESLQEIGYFFVIISGLYSAIAQNEQIVSIDTVCNNIMNEALSDAEAIATILVSSGGECNAINYGQVIEADRQTSWNSSAAESGRRQFSYQQCMQLGWYRSSGSSWQPFGSSFPIEYIFQACADIFDELFSPELLLQNSARFNTAFGGVTPEATNVLYVHGQLDPWRTVGVQAVDSESTTVIIIEGASQSDDIGPISEQDSDAVAQAKEEIIETIYGWISASREINKISLENICWDLINKTNFQSKYCM